MAHSPDATAPPLSTPPEHPQTSPEILTESQLVDHARRLGATHTIGEGGPSRALLPDLEDSAARLEEAYQLLSDKSRQPVASEDWLRDNYHVVLDQVREIRQDLPRRFYQELPPLASGPDRGYPRVYVLARDLVAHTGGRTSITAVIEFVNAYQHAAPLTIGETWAIPIMLRVALVETLRGLMDGVLAARRCREEVRAWTASTAAAGPDAGAQLDRLLREQRQATGRLPAAFVVELLQWLRDQSTAAGPAWLVLHRALEEQDDSPEGLLRSEQHRAASDQLAIGNAITSMRLLSAVEWPQFFDRVNVVEHILREDPAGAYASMDFPTRDRYRRAVEQLARRSRAAESDVAARVIALALAARRADPGEERAHHVGHFLIAGGRGLLERDLRYPATPRERLARFFFLHPALGYIGTIVGGTALGVASLVTYAYRHGATPTELWLVAVITLIPVSELAISLLNSLLTSQLPPRVLPKLDMRGGIPETARTMVVVPAIVHEEARVESLLHDLEVRFLANRDPRLHFALLTDWRDADHPTAPEDEAIVAAARRHVDQLNERYGPDRFFLFHRARRWNDRDGIWMGWERKRGKLEEFNRLLRGATDTSFVVAHGDMSVLPSIRYVITLDSDTRLPMDAARRLVGTISHPLNRPRLDATGRHVAAGYGVLQPRVQVSVESAARTTFAEVFAGHVGVDPYTTAVSDVYQDLFHEGSYVGKGIYDVEAFQAALDGRVPANRLLSHDLFEGFYARAGLCVDVELVDDFPTSYLAHAARQHRWVRGDWQIARWLWWTVPDATGRAVHNTLSAISRWKILDNLRRSLMPPALVMLLVAGATLLPGSAFLWWALALAVLTFPAYAQVGRSLTSRVRGVPFREHVLAERDNLAMSVRQALLSTVFLLHQSGVMLDAIGRTLVRMLVTRRRLLEWTTAERTIQGAASARLVYRTMAGTVLAAVLFGLLVALADPSRLAPTLPLLVLWTLSPWVAHVTGQPRRHDGMALSESERTTLRQTALSIWRFFDDFITPADHYLIPDNIQEDRRQIVAHRTSPTNIGLQCLSMLAAHDFGYVTTTGLLTRLEPVFATLLRLPRYRGHFYNWYDTRTLAPLPPAYISTVDSGNLAGYVLTLRAGLTGLVAHTPIVGPSCLEGLRDIVHRIALDIRSTQYGPVMLNVRAAVRECERLHTDLTAAPATLVDWVRLLRAASNRVLELGVRLHDIEESLLAVSPEAVPEGLTDAAHWLDRAASLVARRLEELDRLAPWAERLGSGADGQWPPPPSVSLAGLVHWAGEVLETGPPGDLRAEIEQSQRHALDLMERADQLGMLADDFFEETEFDFLFDRERQLFSIGFNVVDGRLDHSYYDTLASEARLASFLAIASGTVPRDHWFKLARALTPVGRSRALLSWSASMFEYLLPLVIMRGYPGTLLDETCRAIVERQIQHGERRGVPWGISESAYYARDLDGNYQYRAFGVPGLGLKRGLGDDLVVAPYATLLATPLAPQAVVENLHRLRAEGLAGRYGYYEAIDYTADRLPKDHTGGKVLVTYMAHHQGMSLLALDNALNGDPMPNRFHADPRVQAAELLLQERIPNLVPLKTPPVDKAEHVPTVRRTTEPAGRRYDTPHTLTPRTQLLSNGSYSVMVTNAGGGYSRRQDLALTRWREDITTDAWGSFIYIRDLESREVWSTTYQPTRREADDYDVTFAPDRAVWRRLDDGIETHMEMVVSSEEDAEIRRVSLTNLSDRVRRLDITSYAEVVLATHDADLSHPAFSNLFIETSAVTERGALICSRRPRTGTSRVYLVHVLSGRGSLAGPTEYETDRARFVGRGRSLDRPQALLDTHPLSNTTGAVLDPIVSLRQTVRIPPGGTARLTFTTGVADSEEGARAIIDKFHDRRSVARVMALAGMQSQIELQHLGLAPRDTLRFERLAGRLLFGDPRLRIARDIQANTRTQAELWKYGISGDVPLLLLRVRDEAGVPLLRELLKAHEYLRLRGFAFDLVVLNEHAASYLQDLHEALIQTVSASPEGPRMDQPGGVFVRRGDLMPPEDQRLLRASARAVLDASDGSLEQQLKRTRIPFVLQSARGDARGPRRAPHASTTAPRVPARDAAAFVNGLGGFADDGRAYVLDVDVAAGALPPAPWSNVVANAAFGFAASECGTGYTWSVNSHDHRLTPWSNDPVSDTPGEAVFIRDEETGGYWSATPLPAGSGGRYTVRHGQGYSTFEHMHEGLATTLTVSVPPADALKVYQLTLRNTSTRSRRVSVTLYVEWVLGENPTRSHLHVVTSRDPATGAVFARNAFRREIPDRVAFLDLFPGDEPTVTGDRSEFIGRNGTIRKPAALLRPSLSNRTGAAMDPCGAIQVSVVLAAGEARTLTGLLGDAGTPTQAQALVKQYRGPDAAANAIEASRAQWDRTLGTLVVTTPDLSMDLMLNRWLLYQTLSCRIWGRSAFYQSSGAFGFRDQLQDTLALLLSAPHMVRAHLLHAASRQFVEGDVQHWWHEPGGQGVRTRFSDDRLWLLYATMRYVTATGDAAVLDEQVPFLEGRHLGPDEHEAYEQPVVSKEQASLYEHCARAVALSLATGAHGLPLMGTGDWNDGMNLVGAEGRGESVWLGWFLLSLLRPFADIAASRGDAGRAAQYRAHARTLAASLERAWDGAWYRRAYFDDGTPLGSHENEECRIDAIAQSWSVLAGGDPVRARQAMASVTEHLVRKADGMILLLTPPFDCMVPSPGYIRAYVPGVRENGGQYTHAALWTVLAHAALGNGDDAAELFAMLNPVNHTRTPAEMARYRAEPYVVAADVYSNPAHLGRGGWTWYTGSSGWMYRIGVESILGITLQAGALHIDPCIPRAWPGYQAAFRTAGAEFQIVVENPDGVNRGIRRLELDGVEHAGRGIAIAGMEGPHTVRVVLGSALS